MEPSHDDAWMRHRAESREALAAVRQAALAHAQPAAAVGALVVAVVVAQVDDGLLPYEEGARLGKGSARVLVGSALASSSAAKVTS